jgi:GGDEF domain-containing protein
LHIDEHERLELLARWKRQHSEDPDTAPLDGAIGELIDEACRGVQSGRISAERCARSGDMIGRAWRDGGRLPGPLADELASVRRAVWDTVANSLRVQKAEFDAIIDARAMIDVTFDIALRRALGALTPELPTPPDGAAERSEDRERAVQADFYDALRSTLATCGSRNVPVALVVMHVDVTSLRDDAPSRGADLHDVFEIVRAHLRRGDHAFQLTDTDFAIICSDTGQDGARALLDRFSSAAAVFGASAGAEVAVTGGFSVAPTDGQTTLELIRVALADREFSIPGAPVVART